MTPYSCSIEWLAPDVGVARVHEGLYGEVGDPYVWSCTLRREGRLADLKGVCKPPPGHAARALCDELYRRGMRYRVHERKAGAFGGRKVLKSIHPPRVPA